MEHGISLTSLMIVVAAAFLVPILMHQFRLKFLPVVVAEIIVGIIIGKSGFNLVAEDAYLELLSNLGLIYLMFLSGLELDFSIINSKASARQGGPNVLKSGLAMSAAALVLSLLLSFGLQAMGLIRDPYFFTIVIAAVSLGVVVPVLKEKRLTETPLGQAILFVTVVLDFSAMVLLAFYISLRSQNLQSMLQLLLFFVFAFLIYRVIRRLLHRRTKDKISEAIKSGTVQIGTRAAFALILFLVVLSETLGVEIILGSFLAGVIVSLTLPEKAFVHKLETFGYGFLIPIFFVMVGAGLDLGAMLQDPSGWVLLPALLLSFYLSKIIPSLLFRKWYSRRETWGAGMLLSANLSLVVAAVEVAVRFEIIDEGMRGALILVAVLTCFISPILFHRLMPKAEAKRLSIGLVGANHLTLPVSLDLEREQFDVKLFSTEGDQANKEEKYSRFPVRIVDNLLPDTLAAAGLFDHDVVVLGSAKGDVNVPIALAAKERGVSRVIVRLEEPFPQEADQLPEDVVVFSSLQAARTLMKAIIEHPSAVKLITQHDESMQEAEMKNPAYDGMLLRNLPFLGEVLVMRIFRGDTFIVPRGNTEIMLGDRLLISGEVEQVAAVKRELE